LAQRALASSVVSALALLALPGSVVPDARLSDVRLFAPTIRVDLAYNRPDNAFRKRLYRSNVALLREPVARRLARVQSRLRKQGYGLLILDAYRPRSVQARMWRLRPDARSKYLANPRRGSKHNRGAAVDLTLVDRQGRRLEMPSKFDEFSPRAHRRATRGVSGRARRHSAILAAAMRAHGFLPNPYEWWHFTAPDWAAYPYTNLPVPEVCGPPRPR
jgi:zinc D-Ala-D-Ala dipeptidase